MLIMFNLSCQTCHWNIFDRLYWLLLDGVKEENQMKKFVKWWCGVIFINLVHQTNSWEDKQKIISKGSLVVLTKRGGVVR